jgi:quinol monooxygenase YgiN
MLVASLHFRAKPHKVDEVVSAMDALSERMRRAPGCLSSRMLADVEDCCAYTLTSDWADAASANSFIESRDFLIFRGVRILLRDEPYVTLRDIRHEVTRLLRDA